MGRDLYKIGEDLQALQNLIEEVDGDVSDEDVEEALDSWMAELESDQNNKISNYCKLIRSLEYDIENAEAEAKRLEKSAKTLNSRVKHLKNRLMNYLILHGIPKIKAGVFTVTVAKNGGKAPLVYPSIWEEEPASAPERFHRRIIKLDVESIRASLEAGESIDDCRIDERKTHLKIT
jgi:hypothetical protein